MKTTITDASLLYRLRYWRAKHGGKRVYLDREPARVHAGRMNQTHPGRTPWVAYSCDLGDSPEAERVRKHWHIGRDRTR